MNNNKALRASRASVLILAAGCFVTGVSANAQEVQHLTVTRPGGTDRLTLDLRGAGSAQLVREAASGPARSFDLTAAK